MMRQVRSKGVMIRLDRRRFSGWASLWYRLRDVLRPCCAAALAVLAHELFIINFYADSSCLF